MSLTLVEKLAEKVAIECWRGILLPDTQGGLESAKLAALTLVKQIKPEMLIPDVRKEIDLNDWIQRARPKSRSSIMDGPPVDE